MSVCHSVCLSIVCLSFWLTVSQSDLCMFVSQSVCLIFVCLLLKVCMYVCLFILIYWYIYRFICLTIICLSISLYVCLSICIYLSIYLSIHLCIYLSTCRLSGLRHSKHNGSATWLGPHTTHSSSSIRSPKQQGRLHSIGFYVCPFRSRWC